MSGRRSQILLLLAVLLLAATFTRPTLQLERPTYRYMFVFDITQSMNVTDIAGATPHITRLEYAKQTAQQALSDLPCGTEAGLALFTGHRAFLLVTPIEICAHYREISNMLGNIDWRMSWEFRSEIAKGIYKSIALSTQLAAPTRLVFLTDGHEAPPIDPALPPQFPGTKGEIKGLIVGVGGDRPAAIPKFDNKGTQTGYWKAEDLLHVDAFRQARAALPGAAPGAGTEYLSSLREGYLQSLATNTGLGYHRLEDAENFAQRIKAQELSIPKMVTTDMRWLFALAALVAFISSYVIRVRDSG